MLAASEVLQKEVSNLHLIILTVESKVEKWLRQVLLQQPLELVAALQHLDRLVRPKERHQREYI
jgi:hypothetical protein